MDTKKASGTRKPGGGTPPPIDTGSFVQFGSTRGKVDLVVRNGKVPGVEDDIEGSANSPAARVVVWDKDGDGYKPSKRKVGKTVHSLRRIPPLTGGKSATPGDLIGMLAEHERKVARDDGTVPEHAAVTGLAVKSVYDRGLDAWPGHDRTTLTRQQWATQRVKAFLSVAAGTDPRGYVRDLGLLPKAHPRNPEHKAFEAERKAMQRRRDDMVEVDVSDIEAQIAQFD